MQQSRASGLRLRLETAIFNAGARSEAERLLSLAVKKYRITAPRLASRLDEAVPEGFAVLALPVVYRRRLRTSNVLQLLNQEV